MRGRYEVADLIKLSKSPLVEAPASLPPKEEWMGYVSCAHVKLAKKVTNTEIAV